MSDTESRGTWRIALFTGLGIALAVLALSLSALRDYDAPVSVDMAAGWVMTWAGLLFVLLAPVVGVRLLRTRDLASVVLLPVALFLGGAALLGLGAWGPFVGLGVVVLAAAALVIWRPLDDASS